MTMTTVAWTDLAEVAWKGRAERLADRLAADGDLHTPAWRDALTEIPRHVFVPRYYLQDTSTDPARWVPCRPDDDKESIARWLELVYSPTTVITAIADHVDRGVQVPVSSSTKPDLMVRMLEALDVEDGMQVLEIGTGTGYNAALLTHRLGDHQVSSVDIDPVLVAHAQQRLSELGYHPTLVAADGADGLVGKAPFDRIIATCAVRSIPPAWIDQTQPGGLVLVHLEGPLGAGNLLALRRDVEPALQGRFLPWWGCFMLRRPNAGPVTGKRCPRPTSQPPTTRYTAVNPAELDGGRTFPFMAQLYLQPGTYRSLRLTENRTLVTYLAAPDGSWCEITRNPDVSGRHRVKEAGPTPLWSAVEAAWTEWNQLGAPAWHEFGVTVTRTRHSIWYRDPDSGPQWPLPTPAD
jgi:methyltransferase of ATP-grasp peptide maturase system